MLIRFSINFWSVLSLVTFRVFIFSDVEISDISFKSHGFLTPIILYNATVASRAPQLLSVILEVFSSDGEIGQRRGGSILCDSAISAGTPRRRFSGPDVSELWRGASQKVGATVDDGRTPHEARQFSRMITLDSHSPRELRTLSHKESSEEKIPRRSEIDEMAEERLLSIGLSWMAVLICLRYNTFIISYDV